MKALSVQEPWATLIMRYGKSCENRTWQHGYVGPLVICASKKIDGGLEDLRREFTSILGMFKDSPNLFDPDEVWSQLRPGYALGIVDVVGYDQEQRTPWDIPKMWHWRLENYTSFKQPFPVKGRLGLFDVVNPGVCYVEKGGA